MTWEDLRWIRKAWAGPIIVKGILTAEDAKRSVDYGAAAVVVSNHGGRQLDSVFPTIRALAEVVAAVGQQTEVMFLFLVRDQEVEGSNPFARPLINKSNTCSYPVATAADCNTPR